MSYILVVNINPCAAKLFVSIFRSFKAGIAGVSSFKINDDQNYKFTIWRNRHFLKWIIWSAWLNKHLCRFILFNPLSPHDALNMLKHHFTSL